MAEKEKLTTMVLNVDLQCSKCYKKVKKLLCKIPEIRDQKYDEKANKVTIKVVCCFPEKIRDKLCSRAGGSIKSIEIEDNQKPVKVEIMVLNVVDLRCSKCYKKIKKLLCKFPEIRDQMYDEKANKVTIKVVSCSPEKIRDKLCCKVGGCITSIEIVPPPPPPSPPLPPPPPPPAGTKHRTNDPVRPPQTAKDDNKPKSRNLSYLPPASPVIGFWCSEGFSHSGIPGNPCSRGGPVQYVGYHGRPIYDSRGGGRCDYFSEENQQSCSIM